LSTEAKPDYYQLLGVSRAATEQEIKSAFLKLASQFHAAGKPRNVDDVEEIRRYATAYRVLTNPKRRKEYDLLGFAPPRAEDIVFAGGLEAEVNEAVAGWGDILGDLLG